MLVEELLGDTGGGGDVLKARPRIAALGEELGGGFLDEESPLSLGQAPPSLGLH